MPDTRNAELSRKLVSAVICFLFLLGADKISPVLYIVHMLAKERFTFQNLTTFMPKIII